MNATPGRRAMSASLLALATTLSASASTTPVLSFDATVDADGARHLAVDAPSLRAAAAAGPFTVAGVDLGAGVSVDLQLERFTVTAPGTRFVVGTVGGADADRSFDPDRVLLLRGHVPGRAGSHAFIAVSEWGTIGRIEMGPGSETFLLAAAAAEGDLVPVSVTDGGHPGSLAPDVPLCGTVVDERDVAARLRRPLQTVGANNPQITQQIELALETDYELFELFGSLDATSAYVIELWGAVSDIYLRDVNTRIVLSFVRLWDTPDDLFNGPDPFQEFSGYWSENEGDIERDVAQFVSGRRDFPYGGAATLSTLCSGSAYGVAGYMIGTFVPDVPSVFGYDVQVTAHELGHNCGSFHTHDYGIDTCNDLLGATQRGAIMSYCSQTRSGANANTDLRFHAIPQSFMQDHIFSVDCIAEDCNGNGIADDLDIGTISVDDNGNGIPDECEDCNNNSILDTIDIQGGSEDQNGNGVPDECEPDCNGNGVPDDLDILGGFDTDLYGNNIPDGCEEDCNGNGTSDYTEIVADMTRDIDRDTVLDECQDCDGDGTTDLEALAAAHNVWVASSVATGELRQFLAVSGVLVSEGQPGFLDDAQDLIVTSTGRILVSSGGDDRVAEFDAAGAFVRDLVGAGAGGLDFPTGLVTTGDGTLLVASRDTASVLEYDLDSGAFLGDFVPAGVGGLVGPWGLAFGPDGNLFVTSFDSRVIEYDGATGAPVGDFVVSGDNGGLLDPHGLLFKPDGNLLVASRLTDQILEYDAVTGAFLGQFNLGGTDTVLTLDEPWTLRLGPDGDVYASRHDVVVMATGSDVHDQVLGEDDSDVEELHINSTRIYIFDVDSGNFVRSYVTGHDTGLSLPTAFDFMPGDETDCNLNLRPDNCDIADGTSADLNGNGKPDECESGCAGDLDGSGAVDTVDFLALLAAWGPNPGHPADLDGSGQVDTVDFLDLLAAWGPCP